MPTSIWTTKKIAEKICLTGARPITKFRATADDAIVDRPKGKEKR
jgi:hypothetical protein